MIDTTKPVGELFTRIYLERGKPTEDSELFRRRLGGYVQSKFFSKHATLQSYFKQETGLSVKSALGATGGVYCYMEDFFVDVPLQKLLNIITLVWRFLWENYSDTKIVNGKYKDVCPKADAWHHFVIRVFEEENIGYTCDEKCGIHYLIDEEFEKNIISVLSCLEADRYKGIKAAVKNAHHHLDSNPRDTKAAVRSIFEALEILVKLMVDTKNLNSWVIRNPIKEIIQEHYNDNETAATAAASMCEGFALWVDGLHLYRHGQSSSEPVLPPLDLTIYTLSSGASFLRWLVNIDTTLREQS